MKVRSFHAVFQRCYKVFRREIIQQIEIEENRFGFEPEITNKVAKLGCRIYEVGISYYGRTYAEGKKIGWCLLLQCGCQLEHFAWHHGRKTKSSVQSRIGLPGALQRS